MFASRPVRVLDVGAILASLPDEYRVIDFDDAHVVLGPTGAFVLATGGADAQESADRLVRRAVRLRAALADRVSWVPFVDALVVVDRPGASAIAAAVVPLDLLEQTLVEGPAMLSSQSVAHLAGLVASLPDDRMAQCSVFPPPTAWTWPSTGSAASLANLLSCSSTPTGSTAASSAHLSPV